MCVQIVALGYACKQIIGRHVDGDAGDDDYSIMFFA